MEKIFNAVKYLFCEPARFFDSLALNLGFMIPDSMYLKIRMRCKLGYWPDFDNPQTFTEKINWLKLYNRKPEYTTMVDKYAVKDYVASRIGNEYIIPTIGVWNTVDAIEWDKLPAQFVLKTTHGGGGGGVVICKDKDSFDKERAIEILQRSMSSDIYHNYREWPYKNVPRRIIAEQYMEEKAHPGDLPDYKFFCFNGRVKFFKVDFDRFIEHHANYYSPDGELLEFGEADFPPVPQKQISLPSNLKSMISFAEILSADCPFLRVDFYNINGNIYFGELTFFPAAGMGAFTPSEWDLIIGSYLYLPDLQK